MERRQFITRSLLATGGVMIGTNFLRAQALKEINLQFLNTTEFACYDLIINGAGMAGYFAAIEASKRGMKVLILDKRTSPGFDIAWKKKLWITNEGINDFSREQCELFFPEGETGEMYQNEKQAPVAPYSSLFDDELLLFAGSIKKSLLRNLLIHNVHVLLMTDVCGIISDNVGIYGVLAANKQGLFTINCRSFVDATENNLFTRELFNLEYKIKKAGFILEFIEVMDPVKKSISVDESYGLLNNTIFLHKGKKSKDQQYLEFEFVVEENDQSKTEQKARFLAAALSKNIQTIDPSFSKAKLYNYALECSYFIEDNHLSDPILKGYYYSKNPTASSQSCLSILERTASAKQLIEKIKLTTENRNKKVIQYIGGTTPFYEGKNISENGVILPLSPFIFDKKDIGILEDRCQVLVAGGGTAGATAALGAAEGGRLTLVAEYFNDFGGTKTMGGVLGYYHGLSDHPYIKQVEKGISEIKQEFKMSGGLERRFYFLKSIAEHGCDILFGVIFCGATTEENKLTSVLVCENGKLKKLLFDVAIDATGDSDIAFFAGEDHTHGNKRTGITQNYSQWDISGRINMPSNTGRDYDIIDNTKISELQRGLFLSHYESHFYDFCPMLTVRESRMPKGQYTLDITDVLDKKHFEDTISRAKSDFDPHYIGSSEHSRCGFLLPHSHLTTVEIPYRSIVPGSIDQLLLSGRGISQTNNAMQFTRMSADVTTLGYVTGQIAAELSLKKISPKDYNVSTFQKGLIKQGFLPPFTNNSTEESTREKVTKLIKGEKDYLLKCCLLPQNEILPILLSSYKKDKNLHLAKALAWFSNSSGVPELIEELEGLFMEELKSGYPEGFIDKYDSNSLYWRINQDIGLLAMSGDIRSLEIIQKILNNTNSGGVMGLRENEYYNNRIDLRLIPFHNRITNLCFYIERLPDSSFIPGLERLLKDEHIKGFQTADYQKTRWRVYGADLELYVGASAARCGSKMGFELLNSYLSDVHSNFRDYAMKELRDITGRDMEYNGKDLQSYINKTVFPVTAVRAVRNMEL